MRNEGITLSQEGEMKMERRDIYFSRAKVENCTEGQSNKTVDTARASRLDLCGLILAQF